MTSKTTTVVQTNTIESLYNAIFSIIGTHNIVQYCSEKIKSQYEHKRLEGISKKREEICHIIEFFMCLSHSTLKTQLLAYVRNFFMKDYPLIHTHVYAKIMEPFHIKRNKSFNDYVKLWFSNLKTIWNNHPNKTPDEYKCMNDLIIVLVVYLRLEGDNFELLTDMFMNQSHLYEKLNEYPIDGMKILGDGDPHCVIESIVECTTVNNTKFCIDVLNQTVEFIHE